MRRSTLTAGALAGALALAAIAPAAAHHGWSWAEEEFSELTGTIRSVFVGNPHARIELEVDGDIWSVELAPPAATARAGLTDDAVSTGEEATVVGHRSLDANERVFKAVRVVVGDQTYDVYPRRLSPD